MLQYILSFVILISVVVFIHEYGHYYFAKKYKVGVTDFSIGFGKELFGFNDKDGTRWKICAIPLGGYVKFFGDSNSASQPSSLSSIDQKDHSKLLITKPLYQRAVIVSAGPIANFILAIFIFSTIFMTVGKDVTMPVINEVQKNSPAATAGLKSRDQITHIDDKEIKSINDVALFISTSEGDKVKVEVLRGQKPLSFLIQPEVKLTKDNFGNNIKRKLIGIKIAPLQGELKRERVGPAQALVLSVKETYNTISMTLSYIGKMIVGQESTDQLGGPIKIAQISGKVAAGKISVKNGGGVDGETAVETAEIEGNYDGNLQVAGTLSVSSSGVAKGEIRYKDLEIALGGKISGTIAEMSDEDFSKSKIKLVKDEEQKEEKKGGGFFGTAKEEDN